MYTEDAFLAYPIEFQDICLVYPPLNEDIVKIGFDTFSVYANLLTKTQEDLEDDFEGIKEAEVPTPFIFLLTSTAFSSQIKQMVQKAFEVFIHQKITILYDIQSISVGDIVEQRLLTKDNFFDFQNAVRAAIGEQLLEPPNSNENPRIRHFKALQRKRDKVKAKQNKNTTKEFSTLWTSLCCMNMGINPLKIGKIAFAATKMLLARYTEKDMYETKIAVALAGGQGDNDGSYWVKDLDN